MRAAAFLLAALLMIPAGAAGQQLRTVPRATLDAAVAAVQKQFAAELAAANALAAPQRDAAKTAVYRRMFAALVADPSLYPRLSAAEYRATLAAEAADVRDRIRRGGERLRESAAAQSTNAPASNPAANQLVERAGATEILAVAADLRKLFSADESAVTLHLNALGLFRGGSTTEVDAGAQYTYAQGEALRRLSGSVTFGAKIPEKEITGLTGLPDADTLFDAIGWDGKYRVFGDRDPRASRWHALLIGRLGTVAEVAAIFPTHPAVALLDSVIAATAAADVLDAELTGAINQIENSLVVSAKFAGQHLTAEAGKNKYIGVVMVDKGMGNIDFTANSTFSWADVAATATTAAYVTRDWKLSAALTGSILQDRLVQGRAAELAVSVDGTIPLNDVVLAPDRRRIVRFNTTLTLPFDEKAKIPLSFTFSNDPNNLKKERYVSGQIGVSYDFGALKSLLK